MIKKFTAYLTMALVLTLGLMTSCTKVGPQGPAGKDGTNGTDGTDGTAGCIQCHTSSQVIGEKVAQWETSVHATGGLEVRNASDCAACHTSQGFLETVAATTDGGARPEETTSGTIYDPLPQNCYTCHDIHKSYSAADWALTTSSPVVLWYGDKTVDFGKGNLCANCHQARPELTVVNDSVTITSPYWGPHHGPQANVLGGAGGYEYAGVTYSNSKHTDQVTNGCVDCHMATPSVGHTLNHDGGHNMEMYPKYDGADNVAANINTNGCVDCHTAGDAFTNQIETTQHGVEELLTELKTALMDNGILSSSGRLVPGKYPVGVAGAYWNYDLIEMDASLGVHNADYSRQLLTSTINYMNSLK